MNIGQLIRKKRIASGLTQAQLYAMLPSEVLQRPKEIGRHAGRARISKIESGKQMPTVHQLIAIANALDCDISDLI